MPSAWLSRIATTEGVAHVDPRTAQAAAEGNWATVLADARRALRLHPDDVTWLNLAARARLEGAPAIELPLATTEAAGWLDKALAKAPRDGVTLYHRGLVEYLRRQPDGASTWWRRALEAAPQDEQIREALICLWLDSGRLPEWGVRIVESTLLERQRP